MGAASDRPDPVELLEEQARTRDPELVPIRYGRMLLSPFAFFRGAAYAMASDLAHAPRTGLDVRLSGDGHLSNFGVYAAPDRRLVFSLSDFDEALPRALGRPVAIAAYLGSGESFDRALAGVAETYADQNERDCAALQAAADAGHIRAQTGL